MDMLLNGTSEDEVVNYFTKFKDDLALQGSFDKEKFTEVPCITPKTEADYALYFDKPHFIEDLPKLHLPINPDKKYRGYLISNFKIINFNFCQKIFPCFKSIYKTLRKKNIFK